MLDELRSSPFIETARWSTISTLSFRGQQTRGIRVPCAENLWSRSLRLCEEFQYRRVCFPSARKRPTDGLWC